MQPHQAANIDNDRLTLPNLSGWSVGLVAVGAVALVVAVALGRGPGNDFTSFTASYLVSYCFFLSLSLGALFFVALQHLVRAGWSVTVRRLAEILSVNTVFMAILFLPILIGSAGLYEWADPSAVAEDELLQHKTPYLNVPFFIGRAIVYFLVWGFAALFFLTQSSRQDDSGDPGRTRWMEKLSAAVLVLFGLTVTFAAFDWLMSLEARWFSTIFGLYFFSGAVVGFFAAIILLALALQRAGLMAAAITTEHYHELGKLLFGFIVFWGYIAFSQYMLIWYANIPEESIWYLDRQTGPWTWVTVVLLFGHLLVPFFGLLSREVKRRRILLGAWAGWMLVVHWIDIYWLVMPTFSPDRLPFGLIDVCCLVGIGSLFLAGLLQFARGRRLVPTGDPRLHESLAFENS